MANQIQSNFSFNGDYYTKFNTNYGTLTIGQVVQNWQNPNLTGESPVTRDVPTILDLASIRNKLSTVSSADRTASWQALDHFNNLTTNSEELLNYEIEQNEEAFNKGITWLTKGGSLWDSGIFIGMTGESTLYLGMIYGKVETTTESVNPVTGKTEKTISYQLYYSTLALTHGTDYMYFCQAWDRSTENQGSITPPASTWQKNRMLIHTGAYPIVFNYSEIEETTTTSGTTYGLSAEHRTIPGAVSSGQFYSLYLTDYTDYTGLTFNFLESSWVRGLQYRADGYSFNVPDFCNRPTLNDNQRWVSGTDVWTPSEDGVPGSGPGGAPGSASGGGYNPDALDTDEVGVPSLPNTDVARSGLCGVYNLTETDLRSLTNWLWSSNFFDSIIKNFSSPMENIVMLGTVPYSSFIGTNSAISIGNVTSSITALKLDRTTYELDCGTIDVSMPYNSFGSFEPFCRYQLYLPYIGVVDLPSDDVAIRHIGGAWEYGKVNVIYHFDVFTGACVAYVRTCTNHHWNILAQYSGNLLTTMPISQTNYLQVYQTLIRAQASVAQMGLNTVATLANPVGSVGSMAGGASGIIGQGADTINSLIGIRPTYGRCGSASSAHGMLSIKKPYLIKSLARVFEPDLQRDNKGYISNLDIIIGQHTGYLKCKVDSTRLSYIKGATEYELNRIKTLLGQGIYI